MEATAKRCAVCNEQPAFDGTGVCRWESCERAEAMDYQGVELAMRSLRLWTLRGAVFRHTQAVRSWETSRGQWEMRAHSSVPGWLDGLRAMQRAENETLIAACFDRGEC